MDYELINDYSEYNLYVGRFQPPHKGHMKIFSESLDKGEKVCIAIRNVKPDDKNPLRADEVKRLWEKIYAHNSSVKVIIIPDIKAIKYGRTVGYAIEEIKVDAKTEAISATTIRTQIQAGCNFWKELVDSTIWEDLEVIFSPGMKNAKML